VIEGYAGVVGAAVLGCAEDVAFVIHGHTHREVAVRAAEFMHDTVFPLAILVRREFEDHTTRIRAAALIPSTPNTVEIGRLIEYQRATREGSIVPVREVVHHRLVPVAASEGELEDCPVVLDTSIFRGPIEVARCVHHQAAVGGLAVRRIRREAVQDAVCPGAVAVGRHLKDYPATLRGVARRLTDPTKSRGAKQIAFAVPHRRSRRQINDRGVEVSKSV
jgi:hypothetical protein